MTRRAPFRSGGWGRCPRPAEDPGWLYAFNLGFEAGRLDEQQRQQEQRRRLADEIERWLDEH